MKNNFQPFITGLQHIGLPTNDIEATIAFYEIFGFQVAYRTINEKANEQVAFLRLGDITIETYENKQAALANGAWDHIALNVTNIEAVFQLAKEKGLDIMDSEIQFLPFWDNGVKYFIVIGPNKEKVELNQFL
ncbi:VOC family protein [bacterium 1xD42-62]|uniref:VOC family protein n=2 Tax=Parablautia muri TaxID=2320879 RepID=A0A9X5GQQ6_9FIRM|nr:VOC family protein [Parablautia muri]